MKRVLAALALASILSLSAVAGEIPTVGINTPAPDGPPDMAVPFPGEIPSGGIAVDSSSIDLSLIQMMVGFIL